MSEAGEREDVCAYIERATHGRSQTKHDLNHRSLRSLAGLRFAAGTHPHALRTHTCEETCQLPDWFELSE